MVAIAADEVVETAKLQQTLPGLTLLTDPSLAVPASWHLKGAADDPQPGTFVVDRTGRVTWRYLGKRGADWPTWADLAAHLPGA